MTKKPALIFQRFRQILQNNQATALKGATITIAVLALFSNDLAIIFSDALQSETTSYILLIPIIFSYMLYRKRKMLKAVIPLDDNRQQRKLIYPSITAGVLLFATAILLYWHGSYTFTPLEYHLLALPILTAGLTLIMFNAQTLRQIIFPIIFLFFLAPPPSEILYTIGGALSSLSSEISNGLALAIGIPSTIINEYGTPTIQITRPDGAQIPFTVDIACSGIYSLIGFLIFAILIVYIIRDKIWKKIALVITGITIIYALNVTRITTILIIGYHYGESTALQVFHLLGSWVLTFTGTLLLLVVSEKILKTRIFGNTHKACQECTSPTEQNRVSCSECGRIIKPKNTHIRKSDLLKVAATITVVVFFLSIQAPVFAMTQTPANIIINTPTGQQTVSTEILPNPQNYLLRFNYRDPAFEETSQQDMALSYIYYPEKADLKPIWVNLEIASKLSSLHRWETCLINYPLSQGITPSATKIELTDIQVNENPPIFCRYFIFKLNKTNQTEAVLYWYTTATFDINSTSQQKNVEISLIGYPDTIEDLNQIKTQQLIIAKAIIDYWEPIRLWSAAAMLISTNGAYLAATTSLLLVAIVLHNAIQTVEQNRTKRKAYTKLSASNQQIIDAIQKASKKTMPTLSAIAAEHQKATGQTIDKNTLLQKLTALEKEGIIELHIANHRDEPTQTWRA